MSESVFKRGDWVRHKTNKKVHFIVESIEGEKVTCLKTGFLSDTKRIILFDYELILSKKKSETIIPKKGDLCYQFFGGGLWVVTEESENPECRSMLNIGQIETKRISNVLLGYYNKKGN